MPAIVMCESDWAAQGLRSPPWGPGACAVPSCSCAVHGLCFEFYFVAQ